EHPEFDFAQIAATYDVGEDALAGIVFPQPLDMVSEIPVELTQDCVAGPKVTPACCRATDQSRCGFGDFLEVARLPGGHSHHFGDDRYRNARRVLGDQIALGLARQTAQQSVGQVVNTATKAL